MFKMFRKGYLEWENYKAKIDFLELFYWQQSVRKQNLRHMDYFFFK